MLKRIVTDLCVVLAFVLLVVGSILAYAWVKERPERAKRRAEAQAFLADANAQANALTSLGDVDLDPPTLTLAVLEQTLHVHQRTIRPYGPQNLTTLGWACGAKQCTISASFLVPFGQEIRPTMTPAALMVTDPLFRDVHHVGVGGVYLGETVEEMQKSCQKRGYGLRIGKNRVSWDRDWSLVWGADTSGKIRLLVFSNGRLITNAEVGGDAHSTSATGVDKRPTK